MAKILIKNGLIINRGQSHQMDILVSGERIEKIDRDISDKAAIVIEANNKWVIPGLIDDQVHFRQPGLEHKADIYSESRAALAGGVTSFMEMPNTKPPAVTQELLAHKYKLASDNSITNYSFYMGATNDNLEEVLKTDETMVCGVKVFMGSSTGNMLVDNPKSLEALFSNSHMLIATHCEDEETIRQAALQFDHIESLSADFHPRIRTREGCLKSSSFAVDLAKTHGSRLHVLHISTKEEIELFSAEVPLSEKRITAEACVHHLFFDDSAYALLGNQIKCNPAIKTSSDRAAIFQAVLDDKIDVIATDHAPHTLEEKSKPYRSAPSGLPLIQHTLLLMLDHYHKARISPEKIVEKMCHSPADLFKVRDRGYLDEGKFADIVIVDPNKEQKILKYELLYKCSWSPLEGRMFKGRIECTMVNGRLKYRDGIILDQSPGQRLTFFKN